MAVPGVTKCSPVVPELHIAPHIILLGGTSLSTLCVFHQIISIEAFLHTECAQQTVLLAIHEIIRP